MLNLLFGAKYHIKTASPMRKTFLLLVTATVLISQPAFSQADGTQPFNKGWFFVHDTDSSAMVKKFEEKQGRIVDLPHDWGVEDSFHQDYPGETGKLGWWGYARYSKELNIPFGFLENRKYYLDIDGAMARPKVYCNRQLAGEWAYGYSSFRVDLTPYLHEMSNTVTIELDNQNGSSRWYPGGGIYRNVWLTQTSLAGIGHWGTFVTTEMKDGKAVVKVQTTLRGRASEGELELAILKKDDFMRKGHGKAIATASKQTGEVYDGKVIEQTLEISNPALWDVDNPQLYILATSFHAKGSHDYSTMDFGIRTAQWTEDGFFLNGKRLYLKGVCMHHDAGALGAVWNTGAWERRLAILKKMGCNAIRTSHNPPAPELLDLCDRMGFVVLDEFSDTWTVPKTPNGYATMFDEWVEKDLVALIHRDRNHPSVIAWSIGNEVGEQRDPSKFHIASDLSAIVHREDPTRPTTAGCNILEASGTEWKNTIDLYGFNYKPFEYSKFRVENPEKPYFGSETASTISSRGVYVFPVSEDKSQGKQDFQMSSYDLYAPNWATTPDTEFEAQDKNPWVAGEFVWTGFDYIGEPTPYNRDVTVLDNFNDSETRAKAEEELKELGKISVPSRSSYFGIIDLAGFPKDRYWLYQARWNPEIKMAHILPHWNWQGREGEITPVMVYTSGDSAELFINGKSQGMKKRGEYDYRLRWDDAVYEPGTVEVVAYKDGKVWAKDEVRTTGPATGIEMEIESGSGPGKDFGGDKTVEGNGNTMSLDTQSINDREGNPRYIYVDVKVADSEGRMVPTAQNVIKFSISGPGEIVATDAGDAASHVPFYSHELPAFNGLCSAIVKPTGEKGEIVLKAESDGLDASKVVIKVK